MRLIFAAIEVCVSAAVCLYVSGHSESIPEIGTGMAVMVANLGLLIFELNRAMPDDESSSGELT